MTNTYDPATTIGKIRMFCLDKGTGNTWIFSDEEISAYYDITEDVRLAAALALEDIASDKALAVKVKKVGEIELTSGVDIAKALQSRADSLRASVENGSVFAVI